MAEILTSRLFEPNQRSRRNCHGVKKLPPNLARLVDEPVLELDFLDRPIFFGGAIL
jgi:hypothetical protein